MSTAVVGHCSTPAGELFLLAFHQFSVLVGFNEREPSVRTGENLPLDEFAALVVVVPKVAMVLSRATICDHAFVVKGFERSVVEAVPIMLDGKDPPVCMITNPLPMQIVVPIVFYAGKLSLEIAYRFPVLFSVLALHHMRDAVVVIFRYGPVFRAVPVCFLGLLLLPLPLGVSLQYFLFEIPEGLFFDGV